MAEKASSRWLRRSLVPRFVSLMSAEISLGGAYSKGVTSLEELVEDGGAGTV